MLPVQWQEEGRSVRLAKVPRWHDITIMSTMTTYLSVDRGIPARGMVIRMSSPDDGDLAKLGYMVVAGGDLARLREKCGMSRSTQAELVGVDAEGLREWEGMHRAMNLVTAIRIGEWYRWAEAALREASDIDLDQLVPATKAAQYLGVYRDELVDTFISEHKLPHEHLGVLGTFVYRDGITQFVEARRAKARAKRATMSKMRNKNG